jgi:hypothetical protein
MFRTDLKLLLKFNSTSIYEEVSSSYLTVYGSNLMPEILSNGNGYVMKEDQYLFGGGLSGEGFSLDVSNEFSMSIWVYPVCPGLAVNPTTGSAESITMPLVSIINDSDILVFKLEEHTQDNNKNVLKVSLGNNYSATTDKYSAGQWHHFWVTYDGSSLTVYLDGKITALNENGSIPASIDAATCSFYINNSVGGYGYNIAKNTGYIDDLFLLNTFNEEEPDIQKVINMGVDYFVDDIIDGIKKDGFSIFFNDPSTITITSAVDDMSYIYLGRNDGKIMRGSPLMWEVRRVFSNNDESRILNLSDVSVVDESGFLSLMGTVIRL